MNFQTTLEFLNKLSQNNNREWFQENKKHYETAHKHMVTFMGQLIPAIAEFDRSVAGIDAKHTVFRIYRDVRFSLDKSPYKINMGAFLAPGGKNSVLPGYYFHLEPGKSFIGGGVYMPPAPMLTAIRKEIYYNSDEFKAIITSKDFSKYFNGLSDMGDTLKTAPKGFPKEWPDIDLLRFKHYVVGHNIDDKTVSSDQIFDLIVNTFKAMKGFNSFLIRALENAGE